MVKKLVFITLILAVMAIPLLVACETTTEVIELTINDHNPPGSGPANSLAYWAQQVEAQSGGRLKLTIQPGGALLTGEEVYRGVQTRVADGGMYVIDALDNFNLNLVMALPFMGWPEQHVEDMYWTLMDEFPEMQDEWQGVTVISVMMMPPTQLHTTDKAVKTPADIEGMKILGSEQMVNAALEAAGATPVQLDIADMTPSLQTGLIEGILNHFPVLMIFGALELTPYHTVFGDGGVNMNTATVIMNTEVLEGLPNDLEKIIRNSGDIWLDKFTELTDQEIGAAQQIVEDNNHTVTRLSPSEIEAWYNLVKGPVHDQWIADCEAKGLPGQEVYDEALRLIAESQ
jgi:TRAP-type C4-dicarboxylate transport system substrate-binding protein